MSVLVASGALSAAGRGPSALFDAALAAAPLGRPVERYDVQKLRTRTAALVPPPLLADLAARWPGLDPAVALALGAVEQMNVPLSPDTALVVGTSLGCTATWEPWHRARCAGSSAPSPVGPGRPVAPAPRGATAPDEGQRNPPEQPTPPRATAPNEGQWQETRAAGPVGGGHGDIAWQMARALGLRGPVLTVSTACTSSSAGLLVASDLLRLGEADQALVVGVDLLGSFVHTGFDALRALAPDDRPPAPFGAERAGLWLGEAAACVLLRRPGPWATPPTSGGAKKPAQRGRLLGGAVAGDAFHMTAPDRHGRGMIAAIRAALAQARLDPSDVAWISAHATATSFNDAMEAEALRQIFGPALPPVHALKPVVGHTLGACALLEVVLILEAMARRVRPPTFAPGPLDPALPSIPLDRAPAPWTPGPVLSINAAFAGHCTALCIGPDA